ncbi:MAG: dockerin type I repeat-containing protein [Eubacteriales bacterium]|nr:dockerin type I repeat-containing protein [Eubacteriales bacterium]
MKKFLAIFLSILMVTTSCVGLFSVSAFDDVPWLTVNGDTEPGNWSGAAVAGSDYSYRVTYDATDLILEFKTNDALPTSGSAFRFWFRDEADATVYTDFITIKAIAAGVYAVENAKYNTSKTENKGADWADISGIRLSNVLEGGVNTFTVKVPLSSFDGLAKQDQLDYWVTKWSVGGGSLHSGKTNKTLSEPYKCWDIREDDSVYFEQAPIIDGLLLESIWTDGWTRVDGINRGLWQNIDSNTKNKDVEGFYYDYKLNYVGNKIIIGAKFPITPSYTAPTAASNMRGTNLRFWFAKDSMATPTGSFTGLVDFTFVDPGDGGDPGAQITRVTDLDTNVANKITDTDITMSSIHGDGYFEIEFSIPAAKFGFDTVEAGDYFSFAFSGSDTFPKETFPDLEVPGYGVIGSTDKFVYNKRETYDFFYFDGLDSTSVYEDEDPTVVSIGKTYSGTVAARGGWTDTTEKTKLTNGTGGLLRLLGGSGPFVGFQIVKNTSYSRVAGAWVENSTTYSADERNADGVFYQTIDLGAKTDKLYDYTARFGQIVAYGILFPSKVEFYASEDNVTFYRVGVANKGEVLNDGGATLKEWADYSFTSQVGVSARYVKIAITPVVPDTTPVVPEGTEIPDGASASVTKTGVTAISEITVSAADGLLPDYTETLVDLKADYVDLVNAETPVTCNAGTGNYTAALNDDVAANVGSYDNQWYSVYYNGLANTNTVDGTGMFYLDLGANKNFGTIAVNVWQPNASGIGIPTIKAFASVNNKDWLELGTLTNPSTTVGWAKLNLEYAMNARYIKLEIYANAVFGMINEIEVYQYKTGTTFSADFANQYSVGYQDSSNWKYNGGAELAGVGDAVYIYTSAEGKTLGEVANPNVIWWDVWVVDFDAAANKYYIKSFAPSNSTSKASTVVPAEGFVFMANGNGRNSISNSLRDASVVGASVYVYDLDIKKLGVKDTMDFKSTHTISVFAPIDGETEIVPLKAGLYNVSDPDAVAPNKALGVLTNKDKVSDAQGFSNAGIVLFQNKKCTQADTYPTVDLLLVLDEVTTLEKINLSFYHEYNSMIGLPKDGKVSIGYSDAMDKDFTDLGLLHVSGTAVDGKKGVVDTAITLETAVEAQYILISFAFGDSPFTTGGKVIWEFIGMTEILINDEEELQDLPEDAILINNFAGYVGGKTTIITRVGENDTLGEVSGACSGTVKDYNYFYMVVVNAENTVTQINQTLLRPAGVKTDVVVPEGGYVLLWNADLGGRPEAMQNAFKAIKAGDIITLYNVDLEALAEGAAVVELVKAGFTVEEGTPVIPDVVEDHSNTEHISITPADLVKLTDGDEALDAGNWTAPGVVLVQNKVCTNAAINPTVDLVLKLGTAKTIDKVIVDFYHCYNVMIGLPKDNKVRLSYSADGETYTSLGEFTFEGTAVANEFGTIANQFDVRNVEAEYIGIEFDIGPSPFTTDNKVVWEFVALTEIGVVEGELTGDPFELIEDAPVEVSEGLLLGVEAGMTAEEIAAFFAGEVTVNGVGTGATITAGDQTLTIIVLGDVNGDNVVDGKDYLLVKRAFLGTTTLGEAQSKAGRVSGGESITAMDYLKIKRHFLGTLDLYGINT